MCAHTSGVLVKNTLDQARESQKRWKEGKPLSLLDGVPFAAKDNTVVSGFPARFGTILNKYDVHFMHPWVLLRAFQQRSCGLYNNTLHY